jgi:hypothetical protein
MAELKVFVCGRKKLEKYEINKSMNIPYMPIKPRFLDSDFKKNLLKKQP